MSSDDTPDAVIEDRARDGHVPERKCILTGAHGERASLIRLALGPDGAVWPDLAAKLPGRGAWIVADRAVLEAAMAKGKLKGALDRAFKGPAIVPDDLADDHRAFVRNTDEQVTAWRSIATVGDDSARLDELTVRIGELIRGRNDLADEMGATDCRRGDV